MSISPTNISKTEVMSLGESVLAKASLLALGFNAIGIAAKSVRERILELQEQMDMVEATWGDGVILSMEARLASLCHPSRDQVTTGCEDFSEEWFERMYARYGRGNENASTCRCVLMPQPEEIDQPIPAPDWPRPEYVPSELDAMEHSK